MTVQWTGLRVFIKIADHVPNHDGWIKEWMNGGMDGMDQPTDKASHRDALAHLMKRKCEAANMRNGKITAMEAQSFELTQRHTDGRT